MIDGAVFNTCEGDEAEGWIGPLEPYFILELAENSTNTTVGECGTRQIVDDPVVAPGPDDASPDTAAPTASPGGAKQRRGKRG